MSEPTEKSESVPQTAGRGTRPGAATVVLLLVFAGSITWTWWRLGGRVVMSTDAGAQGVPLAGMVAAALVTLLAIRVLPPRLHSVVPLLRNQFRAAKDLVVLAICATAFPLSSLVPGPPETYVLWKVGLLVLVPAVWLAWTRRRHGASIEIVRPTDRVPVAVWALAPVVIYLLLTQFGPLAPQPPASWPDPMSLAVGAVFTAVTAGVGEELFYRYWLQSRIEALSNRWTGILAAALVFAMMHLGSHGSGLSADLRVTSVVAVQGVFGVVAGYLWSRYRRFWVCVLLHVAVNGTLVLLHLVGLA